jgi:hypothetical protein
VRGYCFLWSFGAGDWVGDSWHGMAMAITTEYLSRYTFLELHLMELCSVMLCYTARVTHLKSSDTSTPSTYDHRFKRIGHPVYSAIHKLAYPLDNGLNSANRHITESRPLAA